MQNSVKKIYSIADTSANFQSSNKNFLSIELALDGFSYCVLNSEKYKYLLLESFSYDKLQDATQLTDVMDFFIKNHEVLTFNYQRVSISYESKAFTLVPDELFTHSEKASFGNFNIKTPAHYELKADKLNNLQAHILYPIPGNLLQKFDFLFPAARIRHVSSSLIENLLYMVRYTSDKPDMVLHLRANTFQLLLFHEQQLQYINSFEYQTSDDFFYYLFFVLEQMGLEAESMNTLLYGELSLQSDLYQKIKLYVKSLEVGPRSDLFKYDDAFENIPFHYYFSLLNLNTCG